MSSLDVDEVTNRKRMNIEFHVEAEARELLPSVQGFVCISGYEYRIVCLTDSYCQ